MLLPAVLRINKYRWVLFVCLVCVGFYIYIKACLPVSRGCNTSSSVCMTV